MTTHSGLQMGTRNEPKIEELKIESGIPYRKKGLRYEAANVAKKMKAGDSVFFTDKRQAQAFIAAVNAENRGTTFRGSMRAVDGGWRVWKVERKPNGSQ